MKQSSFIVLLISYSSLFSWMSAEQLEKTLSQLQTTSLPKVGTLLWGDIYAYYE